MSIRQKTRNALGTSLSEDDREKYNRREWR